MREKLLSSDRVDALKQDLTSLSLSLGELCVYYQYPGDNSSRFSCNSGVFASELQDNREEMSFE